MSQASHPLLASIGTLLETSPPPWDEVLAQLMKHFGSPVGTVHVVDPKDGMLHLKAQQGLPPPVLDKV